MDGLHLRPGRPLLAASARPWAGALLACCAILVAVLGVLFAHQAKAGWLDHAIDAPIITWLGGHRGLVLWLAALGSLIPAGVLSAAIVLTCLLTGRLNGAVLATAAVPAAVGLDEGLLKPLIHRTYLGEVTYPSGHTTAMFTLAATVTVLLLIPPQPARAGALRVLIPAAACVLGGVVAIAVIGLQWHYFTVPWPEPLSVSERSAGSRSFWTCQPPGGGSLLPLGRPSRRYRGRLRGDPCCGRRGTDPAVPLRSAGGGHCRSQTPPRGIRGPLVSGGRVDRQLGPGSIPAALREPAGHSAVPVAVHS